jgi:hypothetical protein
LTAVPYLADLASLEQHWHAAYYAAKDPDFDTDRFAAVAAEDGALGVRFQMSAGLRLLASRYPIAEIWRRHREGGETAAVTMEAGDRLVIARADLRPTVEVVDRETFNLIHALCKGKRLGDLSAEGRAIERIPGLIAIGWIVGFFQLDSEADE